MPSTSAASSVQVMTTAPFSVSMAHATRPLFVPPPHEPTPVAAVQSWPSGRSDRPCPEASSVKTESIVAWSGYWKKSACWGPGWVVLAPHVACATSPSPASSASVQSVKSGGRIASRSPPEPESPVDEGALVVDGGALVVDEGALEDGRGDALPGR